MWPVSADVVGLEFDRGGGVVTCDTASDAELSASLTYGWRLQNKMVLLQSLAAFLTSR